MCVCVCVLNLHIYRQDIYIVRGRSNKPNRCTKHSRLQCSPIGVHVVWQIRANSVRLANLVIAIWSPNHQMELFVFFCVLWQHSLLNFCSFLTGCFDKLHNFYFYFSWCYWGRQTVMCMIFNVVHVSHFIVCTVTRVVPLFNWFARCVICAACIFDSIWSVIHLLFNLHRIYFWATLHDTRYTPSQVFARSLISHFACFNREYRYRLCPAHCHLSSRCCHYKWFGACEHKFSMYFKWWTIRPYECSILLNSIDFNSSS